MCVFLEISKVRLTLFRLDTNKEALVLPDPDGNVVVVQEKVYVPVKEFPDVSLKNFHEFTTVLVKLLSFAVQLRRPHFGTARYDG